MMKNNTDKRLLLLGSSIMFSHGIMAAVLPTAHNTTTTVANAASIEDQIREAILEKLNAPQKNFTASAGAFYGWYKDTTSPIEVKGNSKIGYIALGYKVAPKINVGVSYAKNLMRGHSSDYAIQNKMNDDIFVGKADYQYNPWLTLSATMAHTRGSFESIAPSSTTVTSVSKYTYTTPTLSARMIFPLSQKLAVLPDFGLSRTFIRNRAYTDNASNYQPAKNATLDQGQLDVKLMYRAHRLASPFVKVGYDRAFQSGTPIKSRNSHKMGAGVAFMEGRAALEYNQSNTFGQFKEKQIKLSMNVRF